jgi:hypothetical protein
MTYFWFTTVMQFRLYATPQKALSQETEQANPMVHLFLSIFLHEPSSEILLPLCQNVEVLHSIVATFVSLLQEAHSQNAVEIYFLENSCKMEVLNIPQ